MKNQTLLLPVVFFILFPTLLFAQSPDLKSAANFVFFTTTGAVSNTGTSSVTQKIGTNNGAITGFDLLPGQSENANSITAQASADLQDTYDLLHLSPATFPTHAAILGNGEILLPGVHLIAEASSIAGDLILDAGGNPNAIFIIRIEGAFSPGPSSQIILTGGALSCNVYWAVQGGAIAMAALSKMKGNFIANPGAVSMAATSSLEGRLLSTTGAIAVDAVVVTMPICNAVLPLTLTSFTLQPQSTSVTLLWEATNEYLFSGYELQRSKNGYLFDSIGFVVASGGSSPALYQWTDQNSSAAINFYRLKMIDDNGTYSYSPIRSVNQRSQGFSVFPNPVSTAYLQIRAASVAKGIYRLLIYSDAGMKMNELKLGIDNEITKFSFQHRLKPGFYFLVIKGAGMQIQTMNILVQ